MKFWDTSAVVPLCVREPGSHLMEEILKEDPAMVVWWATRLECVSALARRVRERLMAPESEDQARTILAAMANAWTEVQPGRKVREAAERLLSVHPLRTADALQLAAALIWTEKEPSGHPFVCLDRGLRDAARKEGFTLLPGGL